MKNSSCKAAAIEACSKGTHQINNVGACIAYKHRILSVGWNSGERTRLKGSLGYTSTQSTVNACEGCASLHAEVAAWMQLPNVWKRASKMQSTKPCRTTKYCEKGPRYQSLDKFSLPLSFYLYSSEDSARKVKISEAMRELSETSRIHRPFQVDLLH